MWLVYMLFYYSFDSWSTLLSEIWSKCILSRVTQITSPGWMHETSARTWCTGKTQRDPRDPVEREVGEGIGMGNTCNSMADSFQCMTKPTTIKKQKRVGPYSTGHKPILFLVRRGKDIRSLGEINFCYLSHPIQPVVFWHGSPSRLTQSWNKHREKIFFKWTQ